MECKKSKQLGMNVSTASGRLVKDLLFSFIVEAGRDICYCCGGKLERSDFSIEHKIPWLDSDDPVGMFFDIENIAFSHLRCNISAARKPHKLSDDEREAKRLKRNAEKRDAAREKYDPIKRRQKFIEHRY